MSDQRSLILLMYAGFALVALATGYVYKEIRELKARRRKPDQQNLNRQNDREHDAQFAAHH